MRQSMNREKTGAIYGKTTSTMKKANVNTSQKRMNGVRELELEEIIMDFIDKRRGRGFEYFMSILRKPNCMECEHIRYDSGDKWSPPSYWCDYGNDEENCEYFEFHDYEQEMIDEENRKHDAQLRRWDKDD